jgi:hypothetical protein
MMKFRPGDIVKATSFGGRTHDISLTVSGGISSRDFADVKNNLDVLSQALTVGAVRLLANNLVKILSSAQPRVPIDTGELRDSGTAKVIIGGKEIIVGLGTSEGTVNIMLDRIKYTQVKSARHWGKGKIDGIVEYYKMRGDFDVALFTHEWLLPYDGTHGTRENPKAQTSYTGPKYLEAAWQQHRNEFISDMRNYTSDANLQNIVKYLSRRSTPAKGRWEVDRVVLARERIDRVGYYS